MTNFQRDEMSDDEESEGSLKNFIQDSDTEESEAESTASSCSSIASDDSRKKGRNKTPKVPVKRRTRANKDECKHPRLLTKVDWINKFFVFQSRIPSKKHQQQQKSKIRPNGGCNCVPKRNWTICDTREN